MTVTATRAVPLKGFPHGIPSKWNGVQWREAFASFRTYYGRGGIFPKFFREHPAVTYQEFQAAVLADFLATERGETYHPFHDMFVNFPSTSWEWGSLERERVRDRILVARGQADHRDRAGR